MAGLADATPETQGSWVEHGVVSIGPGRLSGPTGGRLRFGI